jgi:membrane protease YdiL (CAAX protease family)
VVASLTAILWWAGGTRDDVGLGAGTLRRGALWALALIGLVALAYLAGALLPSTRPLFLDRRTAHLAGGGLALRVFVAVPLGTVLLEEYAFRGVLLGLLRRLRGTAVATAVSSLLFGLWHVLPSLHLAAQKPGLTSAAGHPPDGAVLAGTVLFTAASGVLFCELRRRSGSLLAPMGLHWATNALGYLTAFALSRLP